MLKVGINGFGRIGRSVFRVNAQAPAFKVVAINDSDPSVENLAYLLKYDSSYGRFSGTVRASAEGFFVNDEFIRSHAEENILEVPWEAYGVDVVIDATGVLQNVLASRQLAPERVRKVVVTHAPKQGIDQTVIFGVNEETFDVESHHIISTSICDANAIAPVLRVLEESFGIESGFVTTLHPWLSYQNLVDGSVRSVTSPGHYWTDFSLGRASSINLIPKNTTALAAVRQVLPDVAARLEAISFRIPTGVVATSDMSLNLRMATSAAAVNELFARASAEHGNVFGYSDEDLVSSDFLGIRQSLVVDGRWTRINQRTGLKLIVWYDNEFGYSQRVVDMVRLIEAKLGA